MVQFQGFNDFMEAETALRLSGGVLKSLIWNGPSFRENTVGPWCFDKTGQF